MYTERSVLRCFEMKMFCAPVDGQMDGRQQTDGWMDGWEILTLEPSTGRCHEAAVRSRPQMERGGMGRLVHAPVQWCGCAVWVMGRAARDMRCEMCNDVG
eukprot:366021-Chlamydomonas_euryale.AAC.14